MKRQAKTAEPKKTSQPVEQTPKPAIVAVARRDRRERPNTCRACAGSNFC